MSFIGNFFVPTHSIHQIHSKKLFIELEMNRYFKFLILLTFIIFNDSYYLYSDTLEGISISYGQRNWRSSTGLIYDLDSSDLPLNNQGPNGFSDTLPDNDNYKIFSFHIDFKENHKSRFFYWDYYLNYYSINNEYFNDNSYFKEKYLPIMKVVHRW